MDADRMKGMIPMEWVIESLGGELTGHVSGSGWSECTCPFHGDEVASAAISPDSTGFNCLACDVRGDIFSVLELGKVVEDFKGAVKWLEDLASSLGRSTTTR